MPQNADTSSQLPLFHIVGFTGHRQVDNPAVIAAALKDALAFLRQQADGE